MASAPHKIQINGIPGLKCLQCVGEYQMAVADQEAGVLHDGQPPEIPKIQDAITLAPAWQQQTVMGQLVMACVAVPSCLDHLSTKKKSVVERATANGLALPGM